MKEERGGENGRRGTSQGNQHKWMDTKPTKIISFLIYHQYITLTIHFFKNNDDIHTSESLI